jgi:hypothetical protein
MKFNQAVAASVLIVLLTVTSTSAFKKKNKNKGNDEEWGTTSKKSDHGCSIVYDDVWEEKCHTTYTDECKVIWEKQCSTIDQRECSQVRKNTLFKDLLLFSLIFLFFFRFLRKNASGRPVPPARLLTFPSAPLSGRVNAS